MPRNTFKQKQPVQKPSKKPRAPHKASWNFQVFPTADSLHIPQISQQHLFTFRLVVCNHEVLSLKLLLRSPHKANEHGSKRASTQRTPWSIRGEKTNQKLQVIGVSCSFTATSSCQKLLAATSPYGPKYACSDSHLRLPPSRLTKSNRIPKLLPLIRMLRGELNQVR